MKPEARGSKHSYIIIARIYTSFEYFFTEIPIIYLAPRHFVNFLRSKFIQFVMCLPAKSVAIAKSKSEHS